MVSYVLTFILYSSMVIVIPSCVNNAVKVENTKKRNLFLMLIACICGGVASFRGAAGTDSLMYIIGYNNGMESVGHWVEFELGFSFIVKMLNTMHLPYQCMFFLFSFIPSLLCFKAIDIEKDLVDVRIATLIYMTEVYFLGFNGMRQMIAVSICLMSIVLYLHNKKILAILMVLVATLFHRSALMCLIIPLIYGALTSKYKKYFFTILVIVIITLVENRKVLSDLVNLITGRNYYGAYITRDVESNSSIFVYYIKQVPLILFPLLMWKKLLKEKRIFIYFALMIIGIILSSLGAITGTQVSRIGLYFSTTKIFVLAYSATDSIPLKLGSISGKYLSKYGIILYFIILFYYNYFIKGFSMLVPYGLFA